MPARKKKPKGSARPKLVQPKLLKLDLGSGQNKREGFTGVDKAPVSDVQFDLWSGEKWPWDDSSVDELASSHVIEHIEKGNRHQTYNGQGNLFFFFFEEAHRVIKPGGTFHLVWPALWNSRAFMDPTHCDFIPQERLLYLDRRWMEANKLDHYEVRCDWQCTSAAPTIPNGPRFEGDVPIGSRPDVVQRRMFTECINVIQDFHVVLRAIKP